MSILDPIYSVITERHCIFPEPSIPDIQPVEEIEEEPPAEEGTNDVTGTPQPPGEEGRTATATPTGTGEKYHSVNGDVTRAPRCLKSPATRVFAQQFVQANNIVSVKSTWWWI